MECLETSEYLTDKKYQQAVETHIMALYEQAKINNFQGDSNNDIFVEIRKKLAESKKWQYHDYNNPK